MRDLDQALKSICARSSSASLQLLRWMRRNKALLILGATAIAAIATSTHFAFQARRETEAANLAKTNLDAANVAVAQQTARSIFAEGNMKYAAGDTQLGCEMIFRAWNLCSNDTAQKSAYEHVLVDRLTRGQRSYISMH